MQPVKNKKILSINLGNYGSTGMIIYNIRKLAIEHGCVYCCAYPDRKENRPPVDGDFIISSDFFRKVNHRLAIYTGGQDCFALFSTIHLLKKIEAFLPDIIHIHNIHGSFINLPLLFKYIKKHKIHTIWTMHDCWAITGRCPHFSMMHCNNWKDGCSNCCYPKDSYPESRFDTSSYIWKMKKKLFTGIDNMSIITPSEWLAGLVCQSFLNEYPIKIIHNGINLSVFSPRHSNFRQKHGVSDTEYMLLGVAFGWGERKGLDVFVELSKRLPSKYHIVLVGTDNYVDKQLPNNIISIHRIQNQEELAQIYTAADLFVNPTREEVFGLVNIESLACGTPGITFNSGGSPECYDETCGVIVPCNDIDLLEEKIRYICEHKPFIAKNCIKRANMFDMNKKLREYINIYI